jgi:hypothetical protein
VARDPLNFFSPFDQLPPNHENQLTRALLVVLRLSPIAHATWLRLIASDRELQRLPVARFETQRRAVREVRDDEEPADLISVYLAPEAPLSGGGVLSESDRGQVLDAIVDYGGELLVVVENKVAEDDDWQARNLNITGAKIVIAEGQEAIVLLWRDVLEALVALRERELVAGAEAGVVDDFLTYVEDHFPALGPFRTLRLCRGNEFRLSRRLRQVLGEAVGTEAAPSVYGPYVETASGSSIGANAYLRMRNESEVELSLYPADTLTQARIFYRRGDSIAAVRRLRGLPGWYAGPNFHFGHFERGYCWTCNRIDLDRYLDIWTERIASQGTVSREDWEQFWAWLEEMEIACHDDKREFDRHFTETKRSSASPRPGIWLSRRWSLEEAEHLDAGEGLVRQVSDSLDVALDAFGERLSAT